jgi:hypothetical protein
LPPRRLHLTVVLPEGGEAEQYEIQVLDSQKQSRASTTGRADLRNNVMTIQTTLDLSSVPIGNYHFAVGRVGEDWRVFRAEVK